MGARKAARLSDFSETIREATHSRALTFERNCAGSCQDPVHVEHTGSKAPPDLLVEKQRWRGSSRPTVTLELQARCRKCPSCLAARSAHWRERMTAEILGAWRTWFVTLTWSPEAHENCKARAVVGLADKSVPWREAKPARRWQVYEREHYRDVQLFLKRLRKNTGAPMRFAAVTEQHKSGEPHVHLLLHETSLTAPVRHAKLKEAWTAGFLDAHLVAQDEDSTAAAYAAKYLSKCREAQVRASKAYGSFNRDPFLAI